MTCSKAMAAYKEVMPRVEHRRYNGLTNHTETALQPTRYCERPMRRFKSAGHCPALALDLCADGATNPRAGLPASPSVARRFQLEKEVNSLQTASEVSSTLGDPLSYR